MKNSFSSYRFSFFGRSKTFQFMEKYLYWKVTVKGYFLLIIEKLIVTYMANPEYLIISVAWDKDQTHFFHPEMFINC